MVLPGERLRAVRALERRFTCVLSRMIDQVLFARERLAAEGAPMRRFARVLPNMIQ